MLFVTILGFEFAKELPLREDCTWASVLDEGVSKGSCNWQLYGSRKPDNEAYRLTHVFNVSKDEDDGEFTNVMESPDEYTTSFDKFKMLSVRYPNFPKYEMKRDVAQIMESRNKSGKKRGGRDLQNARNSRMRLTAPPIMSPTSSTTDLMALQQELCPMHEIATKEDLERWDAYIDATFDGNVKEYKLYSIHQYAKILPDRFYKEGSYSEWISLAIALKNTHEMFFITWVMVSSKQSGFDYSNIPSLYNTWSKIEKRNTGEKMLTSRSIMYWAKQYNPEDWERINKHTLMYYINEAIEHDNDREIAQVLFQAEKQKFVCAALTNTSQTWYEYKGHRWILDQGMRVRSNGISESLYNLFYLEHKKIMEDIQSTNTANIEGGEMQDKEYVNNLRKSKSCTSIMEKCHNANKKSHIIKEAGELFWDGDFQDELDQNMYLLGCANGVVDLRDGSFRDGVPHDYISKTTGVDYITHEEMNTPGNLKIQAEINKFMSELFVDESLREYMWEHLGSTLIGANISQTFNIYRGSGSNGKSLLTELMSLSLGEYCNPTAPINIITSKRAAVGGSSSELYALKSCRYAVFQEPTKGMVLNEGAMKEMTGDSKIQARELYQTSTSFNQMFTLAVCTNELFEVKSNDEGTWRRIRVVEFMAKFVDADKLDSVLRSEKDKESNKYVFKKDMDLKQKLPVWSISVLVYAR